MASPLIDTKPVLPLVDANNQSSSGVGGSLLDKGGGGGAAPAPAAAASQSRENGAEAARELKISLLPSIFEVVKTMEEKDAAKVSASDVTNQLNIFHAKLKKAREAVEKHLPAATIANMTLDDQEEQLRILRDQLKMNSNLMASYTKIMSAAFVAPSPHSGTDLSETAR